MEIVAAFFAALAAGAAVFFLVRWREAEAKLGAIGPIDVARKGVEDARRAAAEELRLAETARQAASQAMVTAQVQIAERLDGGRREFEELEREIVALRKQKDDVDAQVAAAALKGNEAVRALEAKWAEINAQIEAIEPRFEAATIVESVGLYMPRFNFGEAVEYKAKLEEIRQRQEWAVKDGDAATCSAEWVVDGSRAAGKRSTNNHLKLLLRAFNGECDALVAKVRYDNARSYSERMRKAFDAINKMGDPNRCSLAEAYLALKLDELALVHEYQEKVQEEREEQRAIREQLREEEKAREEAERAKREAEEEEARFERALTKARAEYEISSGAKHAKLFDQIEELQRRLQEAQELKRRATSMAQLTRSGHVYVLSNVGSFGETVFKVGMTRRLDPRDRVVELGDASVPFPFDVHAMIYTTDAPKLENALHKLLNLNRVNGVNMRKEFFRASIDEIEAIVKNHHGEFRLTKLAEAREYRKTMELRATLVEPTMPPPVPTRPSARPMKIGPSVAPQESLAVATGANDE